MAIQAPVKVSDQVFTGEAKTLSFTITDATGAAQNITGWTLQWKLEPSQGATAVVTRSGTVVSGPAGTCTVALTAGDTVALAGGSYFHHLDRTDSGSEAVLSAGLFALQAR